MIRDVYRGCLMMLGQNEFSVHLLPLQIRDIHIILGMDSLSKYKASMYCFKKVVIF